MTEPDPASKPELVPDDAALSTPVHRDLPDLDTRIREAQRQARERRIEQGLPPDADDGGYTPQKSRKHAAKRGKKHGQFLGTVADSWEATRRR
jgi:hypothetical protein